MNVTLDTLEIRHIELPTNYIAFGAVLFVAMSTYIVKSLVSLFDRCNATPVANQCYLPAALDDLEESL